MQKKRETGKKEVKNTIQVDDPIPFRFLKSKKQDVDFNLDLDFKEKPAPVSSKLDRIVQLTGFSDPVYVEAIFEIHQYDISLDLLIVNQTNETLQNLSIEFSTLGDLKLIERPAPVTLAPHGYHTVKVSLRVSSTETGVIFGNIVYDGQSALDSKCVILNEIHIDIMEFIKPEDISETTFRSMWTEFEWENKINITTDITDLQEFLDHLLKKTNMKCLTPLASQGNCGILVANLYARTIFGEDALANISMEQGVDGEVVTGHVRIRAKTQGIALSMGDKMTMSMKKV